MSRAFVLAIVFLTWPMLCPPVMAADSETPTLELALVRQAPKLIKHFKDNKYRNVGVLKFLIVPAGEKKLSDNVGMMNMLMARRLEVAILLANDARAPVGIIKNASAVAARTRGANHRSPDGRKALFDAEYTRAWGKGEVKADAFVTGIAVPGKDLGTMKVSLFLFDRVKNKLEPIGDDFEVRLDATKLAEMNQSFVLRGNSPSDTAAATAATAIRTREATHPLSESEKMPVRLEVLYDSKAVKFEYKDGKAYVPEPKEGQKVAFRLRRDGSKERYGVVLKVNGENTIGREKVPDLHCRRWILDAGDEPATIKGYQIDEKKAEAFRVLSRAESKQREMDYGEDVGTISLTVFRERKGDDEADEDREKERAKTVAKAKVPDEADTLAGLKEQFLKQGNDETRGLVAPGEKVESKTEKVKFRASPVPVMSVTVVYYKR